MSPDAYFSEIVLPTVREFLAARGDRRRAYLACIAAFHLCDYISTAEGEKLELVKEKVRRACEPSFLVMQGVCNGTKHPFLFSIAPASVVLSRFSAVFGRALSDGKKEVSARNAFSGDRLFIWRFQSIGKSLLDDAPAL